MTIVGIMMVKNEERFIAGALRNIVDFCDRVIVIDTGSTDKTIDQVAEVDGEIDEPMKIHLVEERDLTKTHRIAERYFGTDNWIFGVDGDEIYDPAGLAETRRNIEAGQYDGAYQVKGTYLHATEYTEDGRLIGYLGPPSHNPTKLYNFANIDEWPSDGKHNLFLAKTQKVKKGSFRFDTDMPWENEALRCLHMRFFQRSHTDTKEELGRRLNAADLLGYGSRQDRGGKDESNDRLIYRIGELVTVDTTPFGRFDSWPMS